MPTSPRRARRTASARAEPRPASRQIASSLAAPRRWNSRPSTIDADADAAFPPLETHVTPYDGGSMRSIVLAHEKDFRIGPVSVKPSTRTRSDEHTSELQSPMY